MNELTLAGLAAAALPETDFSRVYARTTTGGIAHAIVESTTGKRFEIAAPTNHAQAAELLSELPILKLLAGLRDENQFPLQTPLPCGWAKTAVGHAFLFPQLPGTPRKSTDIWTDTHLAVGLGRALAVLHALPTTQVSSLGVPNYSLPTCRQRLLTSLKQVESSKIVPTALEKRWRAKLANETWWQAPAQFVHGAIDEDSLCFKGDTVVALQYFSSAHIGDVARDFSWFFAAATPQCQEACLESYFAAGGRQDEFLTKRIELDAEMAMVRWLLHGLTTENADIVNDARVMMRDLVNFIGEGDSADTVTAAFSQPIPIVGTPLTGITEIGQASQASQASQAYPQAPTGSDTATVVMSEDEIRQLFTNT
ncbi:MAG: phosphotransferase [Actinomycetaceae bacterium]|nr:phosphotransferase [Actinomycetaceae bacterium]